MPPYTECYIITHIYLGAEAKFQEPWTKEHGTSGKFLEVVLLFRPVCSPVKVDQGFTSGCHFHGFRFVGMDLVGGQYAMGRVGSLGVVIGTTACLIASASCDDLLPGSRSLPRYAHAAEGERPQREPAHRPRSARAYSTARRPHRPRHQDNPHPKATGTTRPFRRSELKNTFLKPPDCGKTGAPLQQYYILNRLAVELEAAGTGASSKDPGPRSSSQRPLAQSPRSAAHGSWVIRVTVIYAKTNGTRLNRFACCKKTLPPRQIYGGFAV